jgi:hypothetical protein
MIDPVELAGFCLVAGNGLLQYPRKFIGAGLWPSPAPGFMAWFFGIAQLYGETSLQVMFILTSRMGLATMAPWRASPSSTRAQA